MPKEAGVAAKVEQLCSENDISGATLTKDSAGCEGREFAMARRVRQLEEENQRLRSVVADLTLSNHALKLAVSEKW